MLKAFVCKYLFYLTHRPW